MKLLHEYITEIVKKGYNAVGYHEVMMFYGTALQPGVLPASDEEQVEFHRLLDIDEDAAHEYLNKWLVSRGLKALDITG
jgi:hypothetical protein